MDVELIAIGKIVRVHGIAGEVVVVPLTDFVDRFEDLESVVIEGDSSRRLKVRAIRFHKNQILMSLATIDSRNDAEACIGSFVSVTRAELVELPEGTLFQFDVVGMKVVTEDGRLLGTIKAVIEMPANDIWRVEGERSFDLPATGNIVLNVDKTSRTVTIRMIEGLLELNP